jgi:hypothetical protein
MTWSWRWKHCGSPKYQEPLAQWYSIISQNIWIFRNNSVRTQIL